MRETNMFKQEKSLKSYLYEYKDVTISDLNHEIINLEDNLDILEYYNTYLLFEELYNSNRIEGSSLDRFDTKLLIEKSIMPENTSLLSALEVLNLDDAMKTYPKIVDLSEELLLDIHRTITHRILSPRESGKYRECPVHIVGTDLITSNWEDVPKRISECIDKYNKSRRGLIDIFRFKYELVTIHPFVDGNGRVSRLIMNALLRGQGHFRLVITDEDKKHYYKALEKSQKAFNDYHFIHYCLVLMKYSIENLIKGE